MAHLDELVGKDAGFPRAPQDQDLHRAIAFPHDRAAPAGSGDARPGRRRPCRARRLASVLRYPARQGKPRARLDGATAVRRAVPPGYAP
jgi:hypothetical protein